MKDRDFWIVIIFLVIIILLLYVLKKRKQEKDEQRLTYLEEEYDERVVGPVVPPPPPPPPLPTFTVSPLSGPIGSLFTLTSLGAGSITGVRVNGTDAVIIERNGNDIVCMVMPGSTDGPVQILVGMQLGSGMSYDVTSPCPPTAIQGPKLVGTGSAPGFVFQGYTVAISADGNTFVSGAQQDNSLTGAVWVFTRTAGVWSQQGPKLVPNDVVGGAVVGGSSESISISADGNTFAVGGYSDNSGVGAVWVFTRTAGVWTQQGAKLIGTGATGVAPQQGSSTALSADGNTLIFGGASDNVNVGAVWVFTRTAGVWSQQGPKLVPNDYLGFSTYFGVSMAISADGNTFISGGPTDFNFQGAFWTFTRTAGVWTQQGPRVAGTGMVGSLVLFGNGLALSADGNIAAVTGYYDDNQKGAIWVFDRIAGVWTQRGAKIVPISIIGTQPRFDMITLDASGNTMVVGAVNDNPTPWPNKGAAFLLQWDGLVWNQVAKILDPNQITSSAFGSNLALSADGSTLVVTAFNDPSGSGEGANFAYSSGSC